MRLLADPQAFSAALDRVRCPGLLVHGGLDPIVPVEFAIAAARARPAWSLQVFDPLGHLPHLEDPPGWLSVVDHWLVST